MIAVKRVLREAVRLAPFFAVGVLFAIAVDRLIRLARWLLDAAPTVTNPGAYIGSAACLLTLFFGTVAGVATHRYDRRKQTR